MRSICSWGRPLLEQPQPLRREEPPQRRRGSRGRPPPDHLLAHRRAETRRDRDGRSPSAARITSSRGISGGGLKKCIPTTLDGRAGAPASASPDRRRVRGEHQSSPPTTDRAPKRSRFSSARSGAASITRSQGRELVERGHGLDHPAASSPTRPFSAHFPRPARAAATPRSRASGTGSCRSVRIPAAAPS